MNDSAHLLDSEEGLLLVGHGTRDAQGVAEFFHTACQIAHRVGGRPVEPCFLEFTAPSIREGIDRLVARGVRRLVVAPVLLFEAGHARHDIPAAVAAASEKHSGLTWRQTPPLGCHPLIVNLSRHRFLEARNRTDRAASIILLMVGRGSHDPEATAQMQRFTRLIAQPLRLHRVITCFCAMAKPLLRETMTQVADDVVHLQGPASVIVQPHLLFGGRLLADIHAQVAEVRSAHPLQRWHVAHHLGPAAEVGQAILDIVGRTAATGR